MRPVTGTNLPRVHMRNFSPVSEMRSSGAKFEKESKHGKTFTPIIALATLRAISLQLNGMLTIWKIQQANARQCHPDHQNSSCFHPGNQAEVFKWQN